MDIIAQLEHGIKAIQFVNQSVFKGETSMNKITQPGRVLANGILAGKFPKQSEENRATQLRHIEFMLNDAGKAIDTELIKAAETLCTEEWRFPAADEKRDAASNVIDIFLSATDHREAA